MPKLTKDRLFDPEHALPRASRPATLGPRTRPRAPFRRGTETSASSSERPPTSMPVRRPRHRNPRRHLISVMR